MGQRITLKIAGKEFPIVANSPEMEGLMRTAAENITSLVDCYNTKYPNYGFEEKILFAAINESVLKLIAQKKNKLAAEEVVALENELSSYLKGK